MGEKWCKSSKSAHRDAENKWLFALKFGTADPDDFVKTKNRTIGKKSEKGDKSSNRTERREKASLFCDRMTIWYTSVQVRKGMVVSHTAALIRKSEYVQYGEKTKNKTGKDV